MPKAKIKPQSETELTKAIRHLLDRLGIWNWKPVQQGFGCKKGIPDIICCWQGKFLAIEVKVGNNTTSEHQDKVMKEILRAGGITFVARSIDDVIDKLGVRDRFLC